MATRLYNVVQFAAVGAGAIVVLPHSLNVDGLALTPDIIQQDNAAFAISADATNVTVQNTSAVAANCNVLAASLHTFLRVFGVAGQAALAVQPFVPSGGGATGIIPADVAGIASSSLVFQPGGAAIGSAVFNSWASLIAQLAVLRATGGGDAIYTILFDDSLLSPCVVPAGAYDMTNVIWSGGAIQGAAGAPVAVSIADGATFTGLKQFQGSMIVSSNAVLLADSPVRLANNDLIEIKEGATVRSIAAAPFFNGTPVGAGELVVFKIDTAGVLGDGVNDAVLMAGTSVLALSLGSQATIAASALNLAAGTTLIPSYRELSAVIVTPQAAALGTVSPIYLTPERWRVRGTPFISVQATNVGDLMQCDPTAGGFLINLPAVTIFNQGQALAVKNVSGSVNPITITPAGADTIDGGPSNIIATGFASVTLVSDGVSNWNVI